MTKEDLQKLSALASRYASQLKLPLQAKVWKGQAGEFSGSGVGSSLDFQDHRSYHPGDDPRHINWQAYARTGQYTMKLYREEVRPIVDLFFDVSQSMFFEPTKANRSIELFYLLCETATRVGASLRPILISGDAIKAVEPEAIATHTWFEMAQELQATKPNVAPALDQVPVRTNAVRIFLSDLLYPGNPEPVVRSLTARQGTVLIFAPFLESEVHPDWQGNYDFIDSESQLRHPHRIEAQALSKYQSAYHNHFSLWERATQKYQAKIARVPSEPDLYSALSLDALPNGALEALA